MKCIYCSSYLSSVVDKRGVKGTGEIRRRRECLKCHRRYTTYERVFEAGLIVLKRDGRREAFSRDKLRVGIAKALEKRPMASELDAVVGRVEASLRRKCNKEVESRDVGKMVLSELKKVDKVAYLRFASVYRQFQEVEDFAKELQRLN